MLIVDTARVVEEEMLKELTEKKINVSWFRQSSVSRFYITCWSCLDYMLIITAFVKPKDKGYQEAESKKRRKHREDKEIRRGASKVSKMRNIVCQMYLLIMCFL